MMIRTCMASIIQTIEDTFRRYMDEYHHGESSPSSSNPMQTATSQQQSAKTQQASLQATVTPDHSLLQEITSQGKRIQSSLPTYGQRANSSSFSFSADLTETDNFLVRNSLSESTLSAYKSAYLSYKCFIEQSFEHHASPRPPCVHHLSAYIGHCYRKGFAASTTSTLISSLSFIFQLGHCVEFNVRGGVIQDQLSAPCNATFPKCDEYYISSDAYKYPDCYTLVSKSGRISTSLKSENVTFITVDESSHIEPWSNGNIVTFIFISIIPAFTIFFVLLSRRRRQRIPIEEEDKLLPNDIAIEQNNQHRSSNQLNKHFAKSESAAYNKQHKASSQSITQRFAKS